MTETLEERGLSRSSEAVLLGHGRCACYLSRKATCDTQLVTRIAPISCRDTAAKLSTTHMLTVAIEEAVPAAVELWRVTDRHILVQIESLCLKSTKDRYVLSSECQDEESGTVNNKSCTRT